MGNLLGAVLCGGESKRMGSDKGLLLKDNKRWAVLIAEKLKETGLPVAISINETQQTLYRDLFSDVPLIVDQLPISGPLNGLLSIHRNFPDKDILLMACDLIDMDTATVQTLIDSYLNNSSFEYFVFQQHGFTQPFCAIYTSKALKTIYSAFEDNHLTNYSLHNRFEMGNTMYIQTKNEASFKNYNRI